MKLIEHLPMVVADNEKTVREAFERGDYLFAFILMHTLVESLLRSFLEITEQEKVRFYELVNEYEKYLKDNIIQCLNLLKNCVSLMIAEIKWCISFGKRAIH